jgi:D-lactate dehydrogenase
MRIFCTEAPPSDLEYLCRNLAEHSCEGTEEVLAGCTPPADTEILSVTVQSRVRADDMHALPNLRLIATRSTGFDHVDLAAAAEVGITVCNVPGYGSETVAEYTFALILSLSRKLHRASLRTLAGEFSLKGMMGMDLAGKTIGVVGAGQIGRHVVQIARGFGMDIIVFDPYASEDTAREHGFLLVEREDLFQKADVVALCCPLTEETFHLLNRSAFEQMKKGVLVINTARGAVIDTDALLWALRQDIVAGAGLDVLEGEEMMPEDTLFATLLGDSHEDKTTVAENLALMRHPNVIVTPHMAYYTREALRRILEVTVENVQAFVRGMPQNVVRSRN